MLPLTKSAFRRGGMSTRTYEPPPLEATSSMILLTTAILWIHSICVVLSGGILHVIVFVSAGSVSVVLKLISEGIFQVRLQMVSS